MHEDFNKNGYLIIKSLIPDLIIDKIVEDIYTKNPENMNNKRLPDIWKDFDIIGELAFNPAILNLLYKLYNRSPIPFQTLNFYTGTEQRLHSDQIHFCSNPKNLMCGVWIALEDITMDQGPLVYYPGSHNLEFYDMQKLNLEPGDYISYEDKIEEIIYKKEIQPKYGIIKKGDAIIWHANLIHGGSKRLQDLSRISMVIHYFFEGCSYWTPLNSSPDNIIYRNCSDFIEDRFRYNDINLKWVKYYKYKYKDLEHLNDKEAIDHFYENGIRENRNFIFQYYNKGT
jgi:hypothetical protein